MKKIAFTLVLSCIFFTLFSQPERNHTPPKTIQVIGSAERDVVPDEFIVQIVLKEYFKNREKVSIEILKSNLIKVCKSSSIADSNISVSDMEGKVPRFWTRRIRRNGKDDLYQTMTYFIKFNNMNSIERFAEKLDPEDIYSFNLEQVSYSKITELRKELKILAIKAAKEAAKYLTAAIDENIGSAIFINENMSNAVPSNNTHSNTYYESKRRRGEEVVGLLGQINETGNEPYNYKKIKYKFEIEVVFELK